MQRIVIGKSWWHRGLLVALTFGVAVCTADLIEMGRPDLAAFVCMFAVPLTGLLAVSLAGATLTLTIEEAR